MEEKLANAEYYIKNLFLHLILSSLFYLKNSFHCKKMKLTVVATLCFTMLSFFALSIFFVIKWFERSNEIINEELNHLFEFFPDKSDETFSGIFIQSNGKISPGRLSYKTYNFSEGLEFCSSMNMIMLDKPAKVILSKESLPVDDGLDKGTKRFKICAKSQK